MPQDAHKLEWLAKLAPGPLRELVDELDCREAPRATVIRAVKEVLGMAEPRSELPDLAATLKAIENLLDRLIDLMGELETASVDGKTKEQILERLGSTLEKLRQQSSP